MSIPEEMGPVSMDEPETPPRSETPLPSLPVRMGQVFFSPGKLTAALAEHPAWGVVFLVGAVLMIAQTLLVPTEVWQEVFRQQALERGQELPPNFGGGSLFRIMAVVGGTLGFLAMTMVFAGLVTLVFAFILGDEGRFKQYLAMVTHSWLIPLTVGLLLLPLKIAQGNPQLTLNLGTFLFFLPSGDLLKWATAMDLSQLWGWLVVAQGAHAIDPRRSFKSAVIALMVLFVGMSAIFAIWIPDPR